MGWGSRLGVLALRLGGVLAWSAAAAWVLVVLAGTDLLRVAGWLSVAWTAAVVAIAAVVGLRLRFLVGLFGIFAGVWTGYFAIQIATAPLGGIGQALGNFWFVMVVVGGFVAGLTGTAPPLLRWFGRGLAVLWFLGAAVWVAVGEPGVQLEALPEVSLGALSVQWLGLVGFAVWALWSARWLNAGGIEARQREARPPDLASAKDFQAAWLPYGPWTRRFARLAALSAALLVVPLAVDRVGGLGDLGVDGIELFFGLSVAVFAAALGETTPRLGHSRLAFLAMVPVVGIVFGVTEPAIIGGIIVAVLDGALEPHPDRWAIIGLVPIGWFALRAASRLRVAPRRLGQVGGAALMVSGGVGAAAAETSTNVALAGVLVAMSVALLAAWLWRLGSELVPGVARPATVFALPGISTATTPIPPEFALPPPAPAQLPSPPRIPSPPSPLPVGFGVESPTRFGLKELARRSGLTVEELRAARPSYRRVMVPKRSGGTRTLLVPDDATKWLQRRLLRRVFARVPVHPAAHGFERHRSIVSNAAPHAGRAVLVRMDVIDFFRTTSVRRVRRLFRVLGWDAETAELLTGLTTHDGGLPTGAPTSPRLANLVNVLLDARLAGLAEALGARYTRYADDLTFSFERDDHAALADLLGATRRIARAHGYRLHVERKLQIRRRHHRQTVTGLVVNERVALPRERRRWLRAVEHHLYSGREATITREQLTGWQAFESMVETSGAEH